MLTKFQRCLILAAAMTLTAATGARADEWCGYAAHKDSVVECGYITADDCQSAVGKGGMCFVDPDVARNVTPVKPTPGTKARTRG